jgi:class 3 adenylate cyclase
MTGRSEAQRKLRTVLFTDIVGSTDLAAQLGDKRWRALVGRHHQAIRRELKRHGGHEVDTAGDGFFATFENPTDGVRCAAAAIAAVHGLGLRIRAGLHIGEVETSGQQVTGIAVHIGARLLALAGPEEVLVSGTLRDLVAGSGQEFEDRGSHELKGVPGEWRVYALVLPHLDEAVVSTTEEEARSAAVSRRRQAALAGVAVVAVALVIVVMAFIWLIPPPPAPIVTGPDSAVAFAMDRGRAVAGLATGRGPAAVHAADGTAWVANVDAGTLTHMGTDGESTTVGQVSSRPTELTTAGGLLWVADRYSDKVTLLGAADGELQDQLDLHASALDAGHGAVWATDDLRDVVLRLDPRDGSELQVIQLAEGSGPSDVAASADDLWVAAGFTGQAVRLDPTSGDVGESVEIPGIERLSAAGDTLWAVSPAEDTATRVDAATSRVAVRAAVCDSPVAVAAVPDEGGAWIVCSRERTLWHLDHAGSVDLEVPLDGVPTDLALDGDRVWVTLRED